MAYADRAYALKLIPNELNRVVRADMTNVVPTSHGVGEEVVHDELMFRFSSEV